MFLELTKGVSLLLALSYLQNFNIRIFRNHKNIGEVSSGLLFGGICIVGMLLPIELPPGIIFDARSVVLSMAGLFGGPIVGGVAGLVAGGYRIWLGGGGVYVGTAVVIACVSLGLAYRFCWQRGWLDIGIIQLLIFGLLVHLVVILLFTQLPAEAAARVMHEVALPFVLTFTPATAFLGLLLLDLDERVRTIAALRDSEARLSLHLQNTPLAAIYWDRNIRATQWNKVAEEIFGFSAAEAIGSHAAELIVTQRVGDDLDEMFARLLDTQGSVRNTNENITKDGRTIVCEWYNTPIPGKDGKIVGIVSLALDITESQRTQRDLQRALIHAEKASQAKTEFLARLSHEFRTPLNAIIGFSEIMKLRYFGPLGNPRYDDYAVNIHESGEHLLELINDVLDISAIEAGKRPIAKEYLSFGEIVSESLEIVRVMAARRRVQLSGTCPDSLPALYADRRAMKQVMINLLSNAIKFSNEGGTVTTSAQAGLQGLTISVADTGIGIEADILPTVTDLFSRGTSNAHLAQEGSGLGLAIVKSLVEAHGGNLKIDSEVGKGTTVRVTIPLNSGAGPELDAPSS
jgi:PAS domain S-box-containing protein